MRHSLLPLVCAVIALSLSSCIFSPAKGNGKVVVPPKYDIPFSPEIVMQNLSKAYAARDTAEYRSLFDPFYIGTSLDQKLGLPVDTLTFDKEASHIRHLYNTTSISFIEFLLKPAMVRARDAGDPVGWALIQDPMFKLTISDGNTDYVVPITSETIEFRFVPKTPDTSSPTDTTWKIIRWTEVRY